jgi:hypothetical protein
VPPVKTERENGEGEGETNKEDTVNPMHPDPIDRPVMSSSASSDSLHLAGEGENVRYCTVEESIGCSLDCGIFEFFYGNK